jgi:stage VI sporulation protein D
VRESSGLRFDIYERVRLPQEAADIREIEEIELTPCVQAEIRGEQVVLRGSLLLGGVYQSDDESRASRQLEHWIPVEITLPRERVARLEELAVEVDNFDVDLLDGRTLNITGVLMLRGVEAGPSAAREQTYAWGDEPYTVVHRRGREVIGEAGGDIAEASGPADGEAAQAAGGEAFRPGAGARADGDEEQTGDAFARTSGAWEPAADEAAGSAGDDGRAADALASSGEREQAADAFAHVSGGRLRTSGAFAEETREPARTNGESAASTGGLSFGEDGYALPEREAAEWRSSGGREAEGASGSAGIGSAGESSGGVSGQASGANADAGSSGTGFRGEQASGTESAGATGPIDWKAFAAQARESGADPARREDPAAEDGDDANGARADAGLSASGAGEAGGAAAAGAEQAGDPVAAEARNGARPENAQPPGGEASAAGSDSGSPSAASRSDLKIAVGAKREAGTPDADRSTGIGKLFFPERKETRGEAEAKAPETRGPEREPEPEPAEAERRQGSSDEVDWRTLFRGAAAQESFRTVRLCIVQKDDTLDSIALRYQRNPREIALANRLEGSQLTEGQVLYIP